MFWFQELVREYTHRPVLLSSLVQLPTITCSLGRSDQARPLRMFCQEIESAAGDYDWVAKRRNCLQL